MMYSTSHFSIQGTVVEVEEHNTHIPGNVEAARSHKHRNTYALYFII